MSLLKGWLSKEKPVETIQQPVEQEASMPDVQEQATQASLQAELDKLTGENAELTSQLANATAAAEKLQADLDAVQVELAGFKAEAFATSRKQALSKVLAEDKVEATFEATKSLDDVAFNVIVANYESTQAALTTTWSEVGKTEADAETQDYDSQLKAAVKQKTQRKGVK